MVMLVQGVMALPGAGRRGNAREGSGVDIVLGLILLALGLGVAFFGLQLWYFVLPIWGFVVGFALSATFIHWVFGDGFLSTTLGIVAGIVAGIAAALIAYNWWYAGALLAVGSVGALLGNGLMSLINVNTDWLIATAAIIGAILFITLGWFLNLPPYMVMVGTAFAGSLALIAGILLMFDEIQREELGSGAAYGIVEDNWYWAVAYFGVALVGMFFQLSRQAMTTLPEEKWEPVQMAA